MPSSKNYIRDYAQEAKVESPERRRFRTLRVEARRAYERTLEKPIPKGKDVDHKDPLSKGGSNRMSNLRLTQAGKNRSYPRTSKGRMK